MTMAIFKDIKEIKDIILDFASNGFWAFFKNVLLIALICLVGIMITHPDVFSNPEELVRLLSNNGLILYGITIFLIIFIIYQLAVSIIHDVRTKNNDAIVQRVVDDIENNKQESKRKQEDEHNDLIKKRFASSPIIRSELKDLLIKLGATRASICEMHNGTNNLSGVPFLYLDMTYEEFAPNRVEMVADEYKNFNMVKYPFIANHINDGIWVGSIDDVNKEDPHLASKFAFSNSNYGALVVIQGTNSIIGFLVVTFKDKENVPSKRTIISAITSTAQVISTLLDKDV